MGYYSDFWFTGISTRQGFGGLSIKMANYFVFGARRAQNLGNGDVPGKANRIPLLKKEMRKSIAATLKTLSEETIKQESKAVLQKVRNDLTSTASTEIWSRSMLIHIEIGETEDDT